MKDLFDLIFNEDLDEIEPKVLHEKEITVFTNKGFETFTILVLDAATMLKITTKSLTNGQVDYYKTVYNLLKYRVKGIDDVESFLEDNAQFVISSISDEINKLDEELKENTLKVVK